LGIGGLGIGPNPQSPIPNPQSPDSDKYKLCVNMKLLFYIQINKI